ncbi:MAG: hypothetical protein QOF36_104 [Microbacteriaceae bacterium]|nr:hypothetical protein [Microbacteriaceae bacterium]
MNCRVCGSELPDGAMFCGECGSSVTVTRVRRPVADPRPSDTTIVQPLPPLPGPAVAGPFFPVRADASPQIPDIAGAPEVADSAGASQVPDIAGEPEVASVVGSSEFSGVGVPEVPGGQDVPNAVAGPSRPSGPVVSFRFALSTGETVVITGSGLLGRRPITQPGEHVDQMVSLTDFTRSVSKTHLEFGLEGPELWICDRYSGNGTVLRPLGGRARLCEPGRRYRVPRGTRVEIGDHYFDVS